MTITRIGEGCWELRTRYGTLMATGDLYSVVNAWARLRRQGWSDTPYGQPATTIGGRPTVECTVTHDYQCRAYTQRRSAAEASPRPAGELLGRAGQAVTVNELGERVDPGARARAG